MFLRNANASVMLADLKKWDPAEIVGCSVQAVMV